MTMTGPLPGAVTNRDPGHRPVLEREIVAFLRPRAGALYVDGTFGGGGYARALLAHEGTRVVGIDRDPEAVHRGELLAAEVAGRLIMIHGCFGEMDRLVQRHGVRAVDGVALDLGVSSYQLDDAARGFSFMKDGPLDMRMSGEGVSAADAVNSLSERELAKIIRDYGEEKFARRIANAIVRARREAPITRTAQLAHIVRNAVPRTGEGIDPTTRTFQALRIWVNNELDELDRGLAAAERLLRPGGRLAVVSFHSLEDRKVKTFLRERSATGGGLSRHLPEPTLARAPTFRVLTGRAVRPAPDEVVANPRARSARLRVGERTDAPAWPAKEAA
jgi:16S rRNA (cytosine1402-N4)-methyltransferase